MATRKKSSEMTVIVPNDAENLVPITVIQMKIPRVKFVNWLASSGQHVPPALLEPHRAKRGKRRSPGTVRRWRHIAYEVVRLENKLGKNNTEKVKIAVGNAFGRDKRTVERALEAYRREAEEPGSLQRYVTDLSKLGLIHPPLYSGNNQS